MFQIKELPLKKPDNKEYREQVRLLVTLNDHNFSRGDCSDNLTLAYSKVGIDTSDLHKDLRGQYGDLFYRTQNLSTV